MFGLLQRDLRLRELNSFKMVEFYLLNLESVKLPFFVPFYRNVSFLSPTVFFRLRSRVLVSLDAFRFLVADVGTCNDHVASASASARSRFNDVNRERV